MLNSLQVRSSRFRVPLATANRHPPTSAGQVPAVGRETSPLKQNHADSGPMKDDGGKHFKFVAQGGLPMLSPPEHGGEYQQTARDETLQERPL